LCAVTGAALATPIEQIVFQSNRGGNYDIWMMDPHGSNVQLLLSHPAGDFSPAISPDGTRIAFVSDRAGNPDIWVANLHTGVLINLTADNPDSDGGPAWSPDGTQIAFSSRRNGKDAIWKVAATGGPATQVTFPTQNTPQEGDLAPNWSPDGNSIVFMSTQGHRDLWAIWKVAADGSGIETEIVPRFGSNEYTPAYSPDGSTIAWTHCVGSPSCFDTEIWFANADGTNLRFVTTGGPSYEFSPTWSPDGSAFAMNTASVDIWRVHADGTGLMQLTFDGSGNAVGDWGFIDLPSVPEPGAMLLMLAGLPFLWPRFRRRRRPSDRALASAHVYSSLARSGACLTLLSYSRRTGYEAVTAS
jgi:TolB protein